MNVAGGVYNQALDVGVLITAEWATAPGDVDLIEVTQPRLRPNELRMLSPREPARDRIPPSNLALDRGARGKVVRRQARRASDGEIFRIEGVNGHGAPLPAA